MRRGGPSQVSRRTFLRGAGAAGLAGLAGSGLAGCTGFATTGDGGMIFLSTQFRPVNEAEAFRSTLAKTISGVSYVTIEEGPFAGQVRSQVGSGATQMGLLGGLHGDLAPLADGYLEDVTDLLSDLSGRGFPADYVDLARSGTDRAWYIPWADASYVLAAHADALEHLPSGADAESLTYDQFLDWAIAARRANGGRPMLGLPLGPEGLFHRFTQGYLLPSFTGGQITTFRSREAVSAWQYLRELWANCNPASTTYDFMQEPLESGEVRMTWDHVVRLVEAPERDPENWRMLPAPRGEHGLGYMAVLAGLAIPKGSTDPELARDAIRALTTPRAQLDVLRSNGFFPVVDTEIPGNLPPAIQLEADAVAKQKNADDAILSLPPVGLGEREGEVSKVFQDTFRAIVLGGADIRSTLDAQARVLQGVLSELNVPCWAPDPAAERCEVG
ncbi:ABC transporter substrate-binding protein [Streptomyces regensis]|uniref:Multiple sugar transport system substrate-binding protein n=2 Tax=Prauserella rugosa TaxID=43354 RepID=A0A660CBV8_9PSEU|nr:extracellular solute-binding protein [Prauserella rugosa]KMS86634.1 ABC transporter substrate-binding protein [Streptomyces regensis]TWH21070.1 multiple sugar transport system substrate-binding protein [Prauserella rugosa]